MKKDEILQKSRQSNNDEGMDYAENRGRKIGFIAFAISFIIHIGLQRSIYCYI